jgi:hypothetical protein
MFESILARAEYEQRIREAEKAYRYSRLHGPSRFGSLRRNLAAFVARF